jgi:hypothetical protein
VAMSQLDRDCTYVCLRTLANRSRLARSFVRSFARVLFCELAYLLAFVRLLT